MCTPKPPRKKARTRARTHCVGRGRVGLLTVGGLSVCGLAVGRVAVACRPVGGLLGAREGLCTRGVVGGAVTGGARGGGGLVEVGGRGLGEAGRLRRGNSGAGICSAGAEKSEAEVEPLGSRGWPGDRASSWVSLSIVVGGPGGRTLQPTATSVRSLSATTPEAPLIGPGGEFSAHRASVPGTEGRVRDMSRHWGSQRPTRP